MESNHSSTQRESKFRHEALGSRQLDPALLLVVPPLRFAMVEEGLYRGAYPTLRKFPFLRSLGLRTIVSLVPEEPTYDLSRFAVAEGITVRHIQVEQNKGEAQLTTGDMSVVLQMLVDADQHPLYIHCLDGRYTTGLVVMGLRKLQHWSVSCSHMEYQRFAWNVQDEVAFITDYSGPVIVPKNIPVWLWDGSWCDTSGRPKRLHTGIRLKFPSTTRDGCALADEPPRPTKAEELNVALPLHMAPSGEGRATYVNVDSVDPARPVCTANGGPDCVAYALRVEGRLATDIRSLSLRASVDVSSVPPPRECGKQLRPSHLPGARATPDFMQSRTVANAILGCGDAQQAGFAEFGGEVDRFQHLRRSKRPAGVHGCFPDSGDSNNVLQPAPKSNARVGCVLQLVLAERRESIPSCDVGVGSKRSRRRNSV